jgi:hypothetical protein
VALGKQKAAQEERVVKLQKQKAHLESAVEQESLQLQQVHVAREIVDKVLKDMASLETEENQGYMQFLFSVYQATYYAIQYSTTYYAIQYSTILFYSIPLACAECDDSLPFSGASSIFPHFILPPISWSTSWSSCFQIHIQYCFGNTVQYKS